MQIFYVTKRKLIFSAFTTIGPFSTLIVEDGNGELCNVKAFSQKGVPLGETYVYYKTIGLWEKHDFISIATENMYQVHGDTFGITTIFDNREIEINKDTLKFHGCYAAVVLFPTSLYVSPVYEDKQVLLRRVFQQIQTQEDYWIIQGPEPLLQRLSLTVTANTNIDKVHVNRLLSALKSSGVSVVYRNPKGEKDSDNFGKKFISNF